MNSGNSHPASTPNRRGLLAIGIALPALVLAGCAARLRDTIDEGVRRLLSLSSQRAFARLLRPGGFYDDQLVRIAPPAGTEAGGSAGILAAILRTDAVRRRVAIALNDVAADAAERAAPVVSDAIQRMTVADALSVVRGGPTAATALLEREVGPAVLDALLPGVTAGLQSDAAEILSAVVTARTGVDPRALADFVAEQARRGIFAAIGREEAAIRADPRSTRDPAIIALLAVS